MKDTTTALYKGKEYSAGFKDDKIIILRSIDENDIKNGFEARHWSDSDIKCIKYVSREEIDEIYDIVTTAIYKGYTCDVFEENGDKVLIMIDNILQDASVELKMDKAIDKGMYVKWIDKSEAEIKVEKKML